MGEQLVKRFNDNFEKYQSGRYARVLQCADTFFDSKKIDWPAIPPRTDVPEDLKNSPIGQMAIKGTPEMKGTVYKYFVKCKPPADDPTAFDRVHEIFKDMPLQYNNVGWVLEGECEMMGLNFI